MEINQLFYEWVPKYVRYAILVLMLFVILCANGVYLGITTDMYSDLGEYAEPYTMATNALYIGMGSSMVFFIRLAKRLSNKTLVLTGFIMMLLMNIVCATTNSPALTIAASFLIGFFKVFPLGETYLAWLKIWSKKMDSARFYPFLYFMALGGLYFTSWFTAWLTNQFSWRYAYFAIFILIALCIITGTVFIENHKLKKKTPLYQLDIPGLLLISTTLMLINYIAVYGKVEDWFESNAIRTASFAAVFTGLLFIRRQLLLKRPLLNLDLFRRPNLIAGIFLFAILGVFTPSTFQSALSGSVLHFESIRNAEINLFLIPGILAGSVWAFFWFRNNYNGHILTIIGFAALVLYHILMYGRFVTDLNIHEFWIPSFIKGFGQTLLYISIGLYATATYPFPLVLKAVGSLVMVRSFLAPGIFSGLYSYFLYAGRNRHLSTLANGIDANEPMVLQQADIPGFYRNIQAQANLTALKEISGSIIIFGLSVITILILLQIFRKIKKGLWANA